MNQDRIDPASADPSNPPVETQVLVVGGSIVGLTAALACRRQGLDVLLAEKHASSSVHPRASRYNARATEVFRALGVEADVRAAGADLEHAVGAISGPTLVKALEARPVDAAVAYQRMRAVEEALSPAPSARAPQNRVEPVLRKVAEARGCDLRLGSEVVDLTPSPDHVTARIVDRATGTSWLARARYAVVADGAQGRMRERLGIEREHFGVAARYVNILFDADLSSLVEGREFNTCFLQRPDFTALLHPFEGGRRWRLQLVVPPAGQGGPERVSRERCVAIVRDGTGIPDLDPVVLDAQPWEAASGMIRAFRSGRVLFAGDAAHQMTPYLGLGASSGIEDAHNLAWKLALVLGGVADDGLLDTYEAERMPVARKAVIDSSQAADENGLPRLGRSLPMDVRALVGLDHAYDSRAVVPDDAAGADDEGRPGMRVPHAWLRPRDRADDGARVSTLDLAPGAFALLTGPADGAWREALSRLSSPVSVTGFRIGGEDFGDDAERWRTRARIEEDGALLVRPDRVVAWRSARGSDGAALRLGEVLGGILGKVG